MSWTGIPELKQSYRQLGARRFWAIMGGTLAWLGIGVTLMLIVDYPDHYGFHCHGRGCWIDDLWHSPALVRDGHALPLALFVWLWSMPAVVLGAWAYAAWKRRSRINFSLFAEPQAPGPSNDRAP